MLLRRLNRHVSDLVLLGRLPYKHTKIDISKNTQKVRNATRWVFQESGLLIWVGAMVPRHQSQWPVHFPPH